MDEYTLNKLKELVEEYERYKDDMRTDYSQIAQGDIAEIVEIIKNL